MHKCFVISELGCNHQGDISIAKEMIRMSKIAGANYAKFQKRNIEDYPEWKNKIYNSENSFGKTYYDHRQHLEFTIEQHKELKLYCEEIGIKYACSVWDLQSASSIISLSPDYIKVPSACNEDYELLEYLFYNYDNPIHISTGMISKEAKTKLLSYLTVKNVVVYHTTSAYPVPFKELYLKEITNLTKDFETGYSGHHLGISVDICAYTLGVEWVERHFTLDRTSKGTDHSASLEPAGLQKLCRDLEACYKALTYKDVDFTEEEEINRDKLKRYC